MHDVAIFGCEEKFDVGEVGEEVINIKRQGVIGFWHNSESSAN
jgi:hypothetical protein